MVKNVLVAPLLAGNKVAEWSRMTRILELSAPHRVHVIRTPSQNPRYAESPNHVHDNLAEMADSGRFQLEPHEVDLFDIEAAMTLLAKLYNAERDNDVVYSLATGLAPGAVVGTLACTLWGWKGLYVGGTPPNTFDVWMPTWLHAETVLTSDELRLLRILNDSPEELDMKTLIDRLVASGKIPRDAGKAAYRRLAGQFVSRLEEMGLVTVGPRDGLDGRHKYVVPTEEGLRAYRMFGPTLREPKETMFIRGRKQEPPQERL